MISRPGRLAALGKLLKGFPVVAILGPRQVGKTTLARAFAEGRPTPVTQFDLENPNDLAKLSEPLLALSELRGLVVLDEIQRRPDLFPVLRVLADRRPLRARFLVLGSASPELLRQSSESLAGRIAFFELPGFSVEEAGANRVARLWLRGGFPRSFTARSDDASLLWRREFARTYLERDLPMLGVTVPAETLRRFWLMIAHWHGQIWNASEFARAFGISDTTVRRYLDLLAATFVVRSLPPWHENLGKRQVKSPKVYVTDSGMLHALLGIRDRGDLDGHPKVGASWEGFALAQTIERLRADARECYFWRTQAGAELDLLIVRGRHRYGFEFKRTASPALTPSIRSALADLRLASLDVIHAGEGTFPLAPKVRAVALSRILDDIKPMSS